VALKTDLEHLTLVPSDRNLTGAEVELVSLLAREYRLKEALAPVVAATTTCSSTARPASGL
jgi:chromosome partitioning protein